MAQINQDSNLGLLKTTEFQTNFIWEVQLPSIINGPSPETVAPFVQEIKFSGYKETNGTTIRYGAYQTKSSGQFQIDDVSMVFLSPVNGVVADYFQAWRELIVSSDGFYHSKTNYAKEVICVQFKRNGQLAAKYRLINAFPKTLPEFDLNYKTESFITFPILFSIDRLIKE